MSFDFKLMTPQEVAFVRLYTMTLKQEYDLFVSTLHLMSSQSMALKCPVQAAKIAKELQSMHSEFDFALASLADKHQCRNKKPPTEEPTIEALVKIIQISFFKLVAPQKNTLPDDKGWFSGHPLDWEKTWKKATQPKPTSDLDNAMTALFGALYKLLNKPGFDDDYKPSNIFGFPFKQLPPWDDEEDDEYYDDEDEDFDTPY